MDIPKFYRYLTRARRDLWSRLQSVPDDVLARNMIPGERFHSIKDLVFHIAEVEDGWLNIDIRGETPVLKSLPNLHDRLGGPNFGAVPLPELLDYWRLVETNTERYLDRMTPDELSRPVDVEDVGGGPFAAASLLWHVMQHEVRHSAQIVMLLRQQGHKPPSLDLLFYLPVD